MSSRRESLTVTLHWLVAGREQATTVVCEDSPPDSLLPLLLAGCGLSEIDGSGRARPYTLRLGAADGRPLRRGAPVGDQGVGCGSHLWVTERGAGGCRRCLLGLPDGSEVALGPRPLALTRGWLLGLMALLNPTAHQRELELLERRESPYAYVSKTAHCALAPGPQGTWTIATARVDVATLLNGARLFPEAPESLGDGDRLTIGAYGPTLTVSILEG
ncbi:MAG TPA: hypothetical protein PKD53_05085 [Chloroflexaceae bacterium]|nr:hypothetical protein [Chloroflexaceae bacterium]